MFDTYPNEEQLQSDGLNVIILMYNPESESGTIELAEIVLIEWELDTAVKPLVSGNSIPTGQTKSQLMQPVKLRL
jgi:hypothetical protein